MACAFSISHCNAKPVPIDIHKKTWQMNTNLIEEKITKKTKAIMVVHLFGQTVDMDPVMQLAKKYNLGVIEDCAESHGVCLLYTSPSPRDKRQSRMPSSA